MKIRLFLKEILFFLFHGMEFSCRTSMYAINFNFTPSGIQKGPTSSLPTMPAQIITPPPPCWRRRRWGRGVPLGTHTLLHPSGPSSAARSSYVNRIDWKSSFSYFLAYSSLASMWFLFNGGQILGLTCLTRSRSTLHLVDLDTFSRTYMSGTILWNVLVKLQKMKPII